MCYNQHGILIDEHSHTIGDEIKNDFSFRNFVQEISLYKKFFFSFTSTNIKTKQISDQYFSFLLFITVNINPPLNPINMD